MMSPPTQGPPKNGFLKFELHALLRCVDVRGVGRVDR